MTTVPADGPRHVLGVVGSLRRQSFNRLLLEHAAARAPDRLQIDIAPDLIRLPLFDEDLELDGLPDDDAAMQERISAADALLLASPEYNFGVPGPVKNFIDSASRPPRRGPLVGKPVALIGASTGRVGGDRDGHASHGFRVELGDQRRGVAFLSIPGWRDRDEVPRRGRWTGPRSTGKLDASHS